jgi:hypothetical protein
MNILILSFIMKKHSVYGCPNEVIFTTENIVNSHF